MTDSDPDQDGSDRPYRMTRNVSDRRLPTLHARPSESIPQNRIQNRRGILIVPSVRVHYYRKLDV